MRSKRSRFMTLTHAATKSCANKVSQCSQHVVDGLRRHLSEILAHATDDRVRVGVRMLVHRSQHRYPRTRDTQRSPTQHALKF